MSRPRLLCQVRRIPGFPIIPVVPFLLLVSHAVAMAILFRRVRSLEGRLG
jgi:hypothetical protein